MLLSELLNIPTDKPINLNIGHFTYFETRRFSALHNTVTGATEYNKYFSHSLPLSVQLQVPINFPEVLEQVSKDRHDIRASVLEIWDGTEQLYRDEIKFYPKQNETQSFLTKLQVNSYFTTLPPRPYGIKCAMKSYAFKQDLRKGASGVHMAIENSNFNLVDGTGARLTDEQFKALMEDK